MLWKMGFFVEGKHLEKVLIAVSGIALNMDPPQPVVNARVKNGGVKQVNGGSSIKEHLIAEIAKLAKGSLYTNDNLRADIVKVGGSESSYCHFAKTFIGLKILKRKGRGEYVVVNGKE